MTSGVNTPGSGLTLDQNRRSRTYELVLLGAATIVMGASLGIVEWAQRQSISWDLAKYMAAFIVLYGAAHVAVRRFAPHADPLILPVVALLNGLGLVLIHRLDLGNQHGENGRVVETNEANQQVLWTLIGVAVLVAVLALLRDHRTLSKYAYTIGLAGIVFLALPALLPSSMSEINGSKNWIKTPLFNIQPSEVSKILLIIFTAAFLVSKRDLFTSAGRRVLGIDLPRARDLAPLLLVWIVALAVLGYANDLGTPLLIFFTVLAMVYVATERVGWIIVGLSMAVVGAVVAYFLFPHLQVRVAVWNDPFNDFYGVGNQPAQALFSLATGGLAGTGLGSGRPTMVPFASTDFIIAAIGEEIGLIGLAAVLMLFLVLIFRGFRAGLTVRDSFGKLLAAGLASTVAIQLFVVVGGVTKLIPLTGLTTPFMSYGGSSLLTNYALIALLLRISNAAREPKVARKPGAPVPDRADRDREARMNAPIRRVSLVVVLLVVALLARSTYVQVFEADELRADTRNERVLLDEYSRQRGSILAGGEVMAQSVATDDRYKYLRSYPKDLAPAYSPLTGYYSMIYSSGGLEHAEESILGGGDDRLFGRRVVDMFSGRDPRGGNIVTTVNPAMQKIAYDKLTSSCGSNGPCHGAAVAIEPQTGKILAMVSTPGYDPNPLSSHDPKVVRNAWESLNADPDKPMDNRATTWTYPPGSTFKVITTAAALAQGKGVDLSTRLTADKQITLPGGGGTTLQNYAGTTCPDSSGGTVSLLQAFQYSCNTAFVDLSTSKMQDGGAAIKQMANNFGMNSSPDPIPLRVAQSVTGDLSDGAQTGQSAIGQLDVAMTPLQNAVIAATLANGGIRMQPYLVDRLQAPDLSTISTTTPTRVGQAITPAVAAQMRELMVASERNTKGSGGRVPIASKTGTAEHSEGQKGGEAPHAWYIGYGPVNDPKVAVAVIIENGGNQGEAATGGSLAAPIGRAVIDAAVNGQGN